MLSGKRCESGLAHIDERRARRNAYRAAQRRQAEIDVVADYAKRHHVSLARRTKHHTRTRGVAARLLVNLNRLDDRRLANRRQIHLIADHHLPDESDDDDDRSNERDEHDRHR